MASISSILNDCLKRFNNLIASTTLQQNVTEIPQELWQDELGRLRVWAANIGAHQVGPSSLDYRLRDASNIRDQIIRLLKGLQRAFDDLEEVLQEPEGEPIPIEDDSELEEMNGSEVQQIFKGLVNTIDCLFQMSMVIRRPTRHDQFVGIKKADSAPFEIYDVLHVDNKYPEADKSIINRLGVAISRRRAGLKYRERHHMKLSKGINSALESQSETGSTILSETVATEFEVNQHLHIDETASDSGNFDSFSSKRNQQKGNHLNVLIAFMSLRSEIGARGYGMSLRILCRFDCPLCREKLTNAVRIDRHLGRHLEELALFALPRTDGDEDDDSRADTEPEQIDDKSNCDQLNHDDPPLDSSASSEGIGNWEETRSLNDIKMDDEDLAGFGSLIMGERAEIEERDAAKEVALAKAAAIKAPEDSQITEAKLAEKHSRDRNTVNLVEAPTEADMAKGLESFWKCHLCSEAWISSYVIQRLYCNHTICSLCETFSI
ncbi:hypothetical protein PMAA_085500 [Talaromyces marneffei ATCC 18224]|uniref:C2H2-type domain-containing protein n=1 Tax=Talaromyces marneffei (strain ATCC 18224 / CBS 334.59 / QM 7333) TaxID=441960 RepID=B6QGH0_TALMQ|nr:hypothetical protein PMAA_085500 [Talaromyces marneffei ATCC 18224]